MNAERLQELRAEHRPCHEDCPDEHPFCTNYYCDEQGIGWPCEQSQILDMALEAERLRAALEDYHAFDHMHPDETWLPLRVREALKDLTPEQLLIVQQWNKRGTQVIGAYQKRLDSALAGTEVEGARAYVPPSEGDHAEYP